MGSYYLFMLLIPAIMLGGGFLLYRWAPKSINSLLGYRTSRSMKSDQAWRFANRYAGKIWIRWGLFLFVFSLLLAFFVKDENQRERMIVIVPLLQLVPLMLSIIPVERALKQQFDENGKHKDE